MQYYSSASHVSIRDVAIFILLPSAGARGHGELHASRLVQDRVSATKASLAGLCANSQKHVTTGEIRSAQYIAVAFGMLAIST